MRNLIVGTGIDTRNGQLPGYSTFRITKKHLTPKNLVQTSLDIYHHVGKVGKLEDIHSVP